MRVNTKTRQCMDTIGSLIRAPLLLLAVLSLTACGSPSAPSGETGLACGEERWAVKTLSDADAARVNLAPAVTTISEITSRPTHCGVGPDRRVYAEEFQAYEVVGRVSRVSLEEDRDYHLVLADPADPSRTMIAEVADPACAGAISSPFVSMLRFARTAFLNLLSGRTPSSLVGETLRVRGVGFYDVNHGQIGRARNCIELHPVLNVERVQ
jgi:hypothetical protein